MASKPGLTSNISMITKNSCLVDKAIFLNKNYRQKTLSSNAGGIIRKQ